MTRPEFEALVLRWRLVCGHTQDTGDHYLRQWLRYPGGDMAMVNWLRRKIYDKVHGRDQT